MTYIILVYYIFTLEITYLSFAAIASPHTRPCRENSEIHGSADTGNLQTESEYLVQTGH